MTKSTITRDQQRQILVDTARHIISRDNTSPYSENLREIARIALSAMEGEPHTDDELSNLLWYSQEATCHSDPNYYCEFQRLATPGLIAGIIRELQERRKADSEPVAWVAQNKNTGEVEIDEPFAKATNPKHWTDSFPVYRHAQPVPVVPEEITSASAPEVFEIAAEAERLGLRGTYASYVVGWNACRSAMLQASPVRTCPSGDGSLRWPCPVHAGNSPAQSDCCPAQNSVAPAQGGNSPGIPDGYVMVPVEPTKEILDEFDSIIDYGAEDSVDAWHRLLAASPQEVK